MFWKRGIVNGAPGKGWMLTLKRVVVLCVPPPHAKVASTSCGPACGSLVSEMIPVIRKP
jgi:hypothetical protein